MLPYDYSKMYFNKKKISARSVQNSQLCLRKHLFINLFKKLKIRESYVASRTGAVIHSPAGLTGGMFFLCS